MRRDEFALLYEYSCWARERLLDAAAQLDQAQLEAIIVPGQPSILATLVHSLDAELTWIQRWQGFSTSDTLSVADLPTLSAIRERWQQQDQELRAWLATLSDAALQGELRYSTKRGTPQLNTLWQIMQHMLNHATHHRSEVALMLSALGHSPGDIDLIVFLRSRSVA